MGPRKLTLFLNPLLVLLNQTKRGQGEEREKYLKKQNPDNATPSPKILKWKTNPFSGDLV